MIALPLILAHLRDRPATFALQAFLLAIGVAMATALLLFSAQSETRLARDAQGIDLVIGAKGSPLQLVMAAVFQADAPTGNLPLETATRLASDPRIAAAAPIGLGDAYGAYRIVGADAGYLSLMNAHIGAGRLHQAPMEAVLGAEVARATGLRVGDHFQGGHGLTGGDEIHADAYVVTGVLAPTGAVIDRLIVTPLESLWSTHGAAAEAARETTAVLVRTRTPFAAMSLQREINADTALVAARPPEEMARLYALVGAGADVMRGFALVMIAAAALSVFVTLLSALRDRRGEIALLRAMGATRKTVFATLMGQGLLAAIVGTLCGLMLGHVLIEALADASMQARGFGLTGRAFDPRELWIAFAGIGAGALAALGPAIGAYRTDVASTLAEAP